MLRRLGGWILYSRTRLGVTAFSCLVLVVVVAIVGHHADTAVPGARPTTVVSPSKRIAPSAASTPATAASEPRRRTAAARETAKRFLRLYLRPSGRVPANVPVALSKVSTPTLWTGLRLADPAALPTGPLRGLQAVAGGAYASEFTAELSGEQSLTVDVVAWSQGWRVSDVHPAGDS